MSSSMNFSFSIQFLINEEFRHFPVFCWLFITCSYTGSSFLILVFDCAMLHLIINETHLYIMSVSYKLNFYFIFIYYDHYDHSHYITSPSLSFSCWITGSSFENFLKFIHIHTWFTCQTLVLTARKIVDSKFRAPWSSTATFLSDDATCSFRMNQS